MSKTTHVVSLKGTKIPGRSKIC